MLSGKSQQPNKSDLDNNPNLNVCIIHFYYCPVLLNIIYEHGFDSP